MVEPTLFLISTTPPELRGIRVKPDPCAIDAFVICVTIGTLIGCTKSFAR